jgi:hypothetical protein
VHDFESSQTHTPDLVPLPRAIEDDFNADRRGAHGIVQPLLVRLRQTLYEVIAGRRRFTAAAPLGLKEAPSVLHQVDDVAAAHGGAANVVTLDGPGTAIQLAFCRL